MLTTFDFIQSDSQTLHVLEFYNTTNWCFVIIKLPNVKHEEACFSWCICICIFDHLQLKWSLSSCCLLVDLWALENNGTVLKLSFIKAHRVTITYYQEQFQYTFWHARNCLILLLKKEYFPEYAKMCNEIT